MKAWQTEFQPAEICRVGGVSFVGDPLQMIPPENYV